MQSSNSQTALRHAGEPRSIALLAHALTPRLNKLFTGASALSRSQLSRLSSSILRRPPSKCKHAAPTKFYRLEIDNCDTVWDADSQPPPNALYKATRLVETVVVLWARASSACCRFRSASSTSRKLITPLS